MNQKELEGYAAKLDATGIRFAKSIGAKGNLESLQDIPWAQVITRVMSLTGWRITEEREEKMPRICIAPGCDNFVAPGHMHCGFKDCTYVSGEESDES